MIPFLKIKTPVILTVHGFGTEELSNKWQNYKIYFLLQEMYFLKYANAITTMSLKEKEKIEKIIANKIKVQHIPNAVRIPRAQKIGNNSHVLFAASRIVSFKGCDIFIKALKKINYRNKAIVIGDLDYSKKYKSYILNLANGLDVEFLGLIKNKITLNSYIKKSKLFVLPSIREAMSMMLLEVAAYGIPIICSDIPGNKSIFEKDEVVFFRNKNYLDLAEKINYSLKNYNMVQIKAQRARKKIIRKYDIKKISLDYLELYNSFIS